MNPNDPFHETITPAERDAWLKRRRHSVGASEASAALGISPWESPLSLWQRKTGRAPDPVMNEAMRWGHLLEPLLQAEYERKVGTTINPQVFITHCKYPFMTATLDGFTDTGKIVEFKTTSGWSKGWGHEDFEEIPFHYLIQLHHQFACAGVTQADLAVLFGGQKFRIYPVSCDDDLVRLVEDGIVRFWKCVVTDTPPEWGMIDPKDLHILFPHCGGQVILDESDSRLLDAFIAAKAAAHSETQEAERLRLAILKRMGNAEIGILPGGVSLRRYVEEQPEKEIMYTRKAFTKTYFRVIGGEQA